MWLWKYPGAVSSRSGQRAAHGRSECLQVRPRGDLGDYAAEPDMLVDAGRDLVGQQRHGTVSVQPGYADTGFIARGFDREDRLAVGHNASRRIV